jgi:hypothetical protein
MKPRHPAPWVAKLKECFDFLGFAIALILTVIALLASDPHADLSWMKNWFSFSQKPPASIADRVSVEEQVTNIQEVTQVHSYESACGDESNLIQVRMGMHYLRQD